METPVLLLKEALRFQERALAKDREYAPALYERLLLLSKAYAAMTAKHAPVAPEPGRAGPEAAKVHEEILRRGSDLERVLGRAASVTLLTARGLLAYHRRQFGEARKALEEAVRQDPLREEAWETLGLALQDQAGQGGEPVEEALRRAEALFTKARSHDPGYAPHLFHRGSVRGLLGHLGRTRGEDPMPDLAAAEEDLRQAVELQPTYAQAWKARGVVRLSRAMYRREHASDPLPDYEGAEQDIQRALSLRSSDAEGWWRLGAVLGFRALDRMSLKEDPLRDFAAAEEKLERAIQLDDAFAAPLNARAYFVTQRGLYRMERGENPDGDFSRAVLDLDKALRLQPEYGTALRNRGHLRASMGVRRASQGLDPTDDFRTAEKDLTEALRLNREYVDAFVQRGDTRLKLALALERRDDRPAAAKSYAEGAEDYAQAVRLNPKLQARLGEAIASARKKAAELPQ